MSRVIALITCVSIMIGMSILVYIYGWGLQPKSWWWIIGVGIFGQVFANTITSQVLKEKK